MGNQIIFIINRQNSSQHTQVINNDLPKSAYQNLIFLNTCLNCLQLHKISSISTQTTFHYDSNYWKNKIDYNRHAGKTGFDDQETKLPTYWNSSFDNICLGMKIGEQRRFILINKQAESLYSLIADGEYRATSLGRDTWKSLVGPEASLQNLCNKEGFNAAEHRGTSIYAHVRIGVISNELNNCAGCDSRLGFGGGGQHDDSNTCGNEAYYLADNGNKKIKAMGYIFVQ